MSTPELVIDDMAAELHAAGAGAGLAVTGEYLPADADPAAPPLDVRAWLRPGIQLMGYDGGIVGSRDEVWYLRADISPSRGDRFTAGGRTWINQEIYAEANGLSRWIVQPVQEGTP